MKAIRPGFAHHPSVHVAFGIFQLYFSPSSTPLASSSSLSSPSAQLVSSVLCTRTIGGLSRKWMQHVALDSLYDSAKSRLIRFNHGLFNVLFVFSLFAVVVTFWFSRRPRTCRFAPPSIHVMLPNSAHYSTPSSSLSCSFLLLFSDRISFAVYLCLLQKLSATTTKSTTITRRRFARSFWLENEVCFPFHGQSATRSVHHSCRSHLVISSASSS